MSRFVSGGTNDEPTERDEAWLKAQQELEAKQAARKAAEADKHGGDGKSLYETLQANKAAKQEAFEESIRLKNQFRTLDEDEVEFLDSVLASTRKQEDEVRRQTERDLDAFRRLQEEVASGAGVAGEEEDVLGGGTEAWKTAGGRRKRKKGREKEGVVGGVKIRRMSSTAGEKKVDEVVEDKRTVESSREKDTTTAPAKEHLQRTTSEELAKKKPRTDNSPTATSTASPAPAAGLGLGLAAYSSDEDD